MVLTMVDSEFLNEYIKFNSIYNNTRLSDILFQLATKIIILGFLLGVISNILAEEYNISVSEVYRINGVVAWFSIVFLLIYISAKVRDCIPFQLSHEDELFIRTVELLGCIDKYKEDYEHKRKEVLKREASIILLEIIKMIHESEEKLYVLKLNLRKILLPNIIRGSEEDMNKSYVIIEKLAKYFLNPTGPILDDLNNSIMELENIEYVKKKGILNIGNIRITSLILAMIIISIPLILYFEYGFREIKDIVIMILGTIIAELIVFRIKNKG